MPNNKKLSLLIVEDDVSLSETLRDIFQNFGCDVTLCQNGAEAIQLLLKEKFNVVISDIKMPKLDGMGLLDAINKNNLTIPVIMMTGYAEYKEEDIYNKGGVVLLEKPFNIDKIKELFENYIQLLPTG